MTARLDNSIPGKLSVGWLGIIGFSSKGLDIIGFSEGLEPLDSQQVSLDFCSFFLFGSPILTSDFFEIP